MVLVVWAFTFGLNERGFPLYDDAHSKEQTRPSSSGSNSAIDSFDINTSSERRQESREKIGGMVQQILELIDIHGILRRPSLDGLRALLLLLPLLEGMCFPMSMASSLITIHRCQASGAASYPRCCYVARSSVVLGAQRFPCRFSSVR
jgi:hypothetical protein